MPANKVIGAPGWGMKYLLHDVPFGKLKAMVEGAKNPAAGIRRLRMPASAAGRRKMTSVSAEMWNQPAACGSFIDSSTSSPTATDR
jgi:hypothetical protein